MIQSFTIDGELADFNKVINANRGHWTNGRELKNDQDDIVVAHIRKGRVKPMDGPIEVCISWHERKRRGGKLRDIDGICAGVKFIFDALVKCGIVPDDNPRFIRNMHFWFEFNSDDPRIEVCLVDYDPNGRTITFKPVKGLD